MKKRKGNCYMDQVIMHLIKDVVDIAISFSQKSDALRAVTMI